MISPGGETTGSGGEDFTRSSGPVTPANLKEGCLEPSSDENLLFWGLILEASKFTAGSSHHNQQFTELIS